MSKNVVVPINLVSKIVEFDMLSHENFSDKQKEIWAEIIAILQEKVDKIEARKQWKERNL